MRYSCAICGFQFSHQEFYTQKIMTIQSVKFLLTIFKLAFITQQLIKIRGSKDYHSMPSKNSLRCN